MLWELFKNNQWCLSAYHTENIKLLCFGLFFGMNQPLQYLMTGCRQFAKVLTRNFCQHICKRQAKFLSRSCLGGNVSLLPSRFYIIEPKKICRSARKTPASATVSCTKLRSGFLAVISFFSRMALHAGKISMPWFRDNKIKVLKCPWNSLVMNPIEKFWDILKHEIHSGEQKQLLTTQ